MRGFRSLSHVGVGHPRVFNILFIFRVSARSPEIETAIYKSPRFAGGEKIDQITRINAMITKNN